MIQYRDGKKVMIPVADRKTYMEWRDSEQNRKADKQHMVQMNYSCLPNDDGTLKGSRRMSSTVGADIDVPIKTEFVLSKKEELGLLMFENSATKEGCGHVVCRRLPELTQEENLKRISSILGVEYDKGAKDITRVFYTPADKLVYLDDELFSLTPCPSPKREGGNLPKAKCVDTATDEKAETVHSTAFALKAFDLCAVSAGLSADAMDVWGEHNWHTNLMSVLSVGLPKLMPREQLMAVIDEKLPNYSQTEDCRKLIEYFYENYTADKGFMNATLREINAKAQRFANGSMVVPDGSKGFQMVSDGSKGFQMVSDGLNGSNAYAAELEKRVGEVKWPQGIGESVVAVGPKLAMPVVTAVCPIIGALATGVVLDVHGTRKNLNLISYIAGDFASGKGSIDPVVNAWTAEQRALDRMYQEQEDDWRRKKRAAKNKKEQPEEPKLPVRVLTLNNTVANLAERLANTEGKHAFSFTPEADTVAQKWRSAMSDFSVMLRQSYDGTGYQREARSAEAVNVHIDKLLWNVVMCGTPDALYRVVNNYTDGFQSRIAVTRTPDNTFAPLEDKPYVLTARDEERIHQVSHLLPLMQGEVVLQKLEQRGREWLETVRLESMKNDDKTMARQRFRVCVTAQRMTCCVMLCKVCEKLLDKHGMAGAEERLKHKPDLWREMLVKAQTPALLDVFDVVADSLMENALHFFRERIERAFHSSGYVSSASFGGDRIKRGRNDSIFERLDVEFSFDQALQHSVAVKGAEVSRNAVQMMLKNWKNQGLITVSDGGRFRKA